MVRSGHTIGEGVSERADRVKEKVVARERIDGHDDCSDDDEL